jgi:hypothetical protein
MTTNLRSAKSRRTAFVAQAVRLVSAQFRSWKTFSAGRSMRSDGAVFAAPEEYRLDFCGASRAGSIAGLLKKSANH